MPNIQVTHAVRGDTVRILGMTPAMSSLLCDGYDNSSYLNLLSYYDYYERRTDGRMNERANGGSNLIVFIIILALMFHFFSRPPRLQTAQRLASHPEKRSGVGDEQSIDKWVVMGRHGQ